jgi:mannosyltransferase
MLPRFSPRLILALITLLAFALRVAGLDQLGEMEYDEAFSWGLGTQPPLDILSYVLGYETHSPAFYWLLHGWMAMVGESEPALRMIAVLPSTLGVAVLGAAVTHVAGLRAGAVAALALALAPIDIFYARYLRMYALASLAMSALIGVVAWSTKVRTSLTAMRALVASVALVGTATFYYAGFGLLGAGAGLSLTRLGSRFTAALLLTCGVLGGAWLLFAGGVRTNLLNTNVGPRGDFRVLQQMLGESLGALAFPFGPAAWALGLVAAATVLVVTQWRRLPHPLTAAALGGFLVSCLLTAILGWFGRPFFPRYVLVSVPFAATLIGLAASRIPRWATAVALLVLVPAAVWAIKPNYGFDCCDYQETMAVLRGRAHPEDAVVLHNPLQDVLYRRYAPDLPAGVALTSEQGFDPDEARAKLAELASTHPRLWMVESAPDWVDPSGVALTWLDGNLYPVSQQRFHNALLRLYLADGGRPPQEFQPIQQRLLDVQTEAVGLDAWTLEAGSDARLNILGTSTVPGQPAKLSARLVAPDGANVWQSDRTLSRVGEQVGVRMGLTVPADARPGTYSLELVVYEEGRLPTGGAGITRTSEPARMGQIEIRPAATRS